MHMPMSSVGLQARLYHERQNYTTAENFPERRRRRFLGAVNHFTNVNLNTLSLGYSQLLIRANQSPI